MFGIQINKKFLALSLVLVVLLNLFLPFSASAQPSPPSPAPANTSGFQTGAQTLGTGPESPCEGSGPPYYTSKSDTQAIPQFFYRVKIPGQEDYDAILPGSPPYGAGPSWTGLMPKVETRLYNGDLMPTSPGGQQVYDKYYKEIDTSLCQVQRGTYNLQQSLIKLITAEQNIDPSIKSDFLAINEPNINANPILNPILKLAGQLAWRVYRLKTATYEIKNNATVRNYIEAAGFTLQKFNELQTYQKNLNDKYVQWAQNPDISQATKQEYKKIIDDYGTKITNAKPFFDNLLNNLDDTILAKYGLGPEPGGTEDKPKTIFDRAFEFIAQGFAGLLGGFAGWVITGFLVPTLKIDENGQTIIQKDLSGQGSSQPWVLVLWKFSISLIDTIVFFLLIFLSFANILRINIDTYAIKKALPTIILGVIVANLSLLICRMIVEISDIISSTIMADAGPTVARLAENLGLGATKFEFSAFNQWVVTKALSLPYQLVFFVVVAEIIAGLLLLGFFILALIFAIRHFLILFLAAISPLAFMAMAFPPTQQYFKKWWGTYLSWVFMLPITFFLIKVASLASEGATAFSILATFVILYLAIMTPFKMGGTVMKMWGGALKAATGTGKGGWSRQLAGKYAGRHKDTFLAKMVFKSPDENGKNAGPLWFIGKRIIGKRIADELPKIYSEKAQFKARGQQYLQMYLDHLSGRKKITDPELLNRVGIEAIKFLNSEATDAYEGFNPEVLTDPGDETRPSGDLNPKALKALIAGSQQEREGVPTPTLLKLLMALLQFKQATRERSDNPNRQRGMLALDNFLKNNFPNYEQNRPKDAGVDAAPESEAVATYISRFLGLSNPLNWLDPKKRQSLQAGQSPPAEPAPAPVDPAAVAAAEVAHRDNPDDAGNLGLVGLDPEQVESAGEDGHRQTEEDVVTLLQQIKDTLEEGRVEPAERDNVIAHIDSEGPIDANLVNSHGVGNLAAQYRLARVKAKIIGRYLATLHVDGQRDERVDPAVGYARWAAAEANQTTDPEAHVAHVQIELQRALARLTDGDTEGARKALAIVYPRGRQGLGEDLGMGPVDAAKIGRIIAHATEGAQALRGALPPVGQQIDIGVVQAAVQQSIERNVRQDFHLDQLSKVDVAAPDVQVRAISHIEQLAGLSDSAKGVSAAQLSQAAAAAVQRILNRAQQPGVTKEEGQVLPGLTRDEIKEIINSSLPTPPPAAPAEPPAGP